ncbi:hypothetical protein C8Q79DRAFT_623417 [Trametes meyenii]|nr:hypothetical protein C8Q79DRAFT_623417 [Trametes meyenii]
MRLTRRSRLAFADFGSTNFISSHTTPTYVCVIGFCLWLGHLVYPYFSSLGATFKSAACSPQILYHQFRLEYPVAPLGIYVVVHVHLGNGVVCLPDVAFALVHLRQSYTQGMQCPHGSHSGKSAHAALKRT